MSEPQADYITDALEMMGISEPRQIVTEVSGFIPVFEVVLHHYKDYMTALVFGRMWQYCGMSDGVCRASLERIGKDLEISGVTVSRHAEKLVADGYLIDSTPDRRNAPHEYIDGRKVEMKSRIAAGMTESKPTPIKSNASAIKSQLIKQDNTIIKVKPEIPKTSKEDLARISPELAILHGMEVSQETIDKERLEREATSAFESAWGITRPWDWWNIKKDWRDLLAFVVEQFSADSECFICYVRWWEERGKFEGGKSAPMIQRDPSSFYAAWDMFKRQDVGKVAPQYKPLPEDTNQYVPNPFRRTG